MRTTLLQTIKRINLRTANNLIYMIINFFIFILLETLTFSFIKEAVQSGDTNSIYVYTLHHIFMFSLVMAIYYHVRCLIYLFNLYTLFLKTRIHENHILRRLAISGKNLKDQKLILKISRDFRKHNTKTDALFIANKKSEHNKQFKKRIEGREHLNKLHDDLREQERLNIREVKRIHDEYINSINK